MEKTGETSDSVSIWPNSPPIDTTPEQGQVSYKYVKNIKDHGEPTPYRQIQGEQLYLHQDAHKSGGFIMRDEGKIISGAVKEMAAKYASKIVKG